MRIKLDENLPLQLVSELTALGHDVEHVHTEELNGRPDPEVWDVAQREERMLITQDVRFADARMLQPASTPGLMLVRLKRPGLRALSERVLGAFRDETETEAWRGCLLVLTDTRLRIRRAK